MNAQNIHLYRPYFDALEAGKTVQLQKAPGEWIDMKDVDFVCPPEFYRVKPDAFEEWWHRLPAVAGLSEKVRSINGAVLHRDYAHAIWSAAIASTKEGK